MLRFENFSNRKTQNTPMERRTTYVSFVVLRTNRSVTKLSCIQMVSYIFGRMTGRMRHTSLKSWSAVLFPSRRLLSGGAAPTVPRDPVDLGSRRAHVGRS